MPEIQTYSPILANDRAMPLSERQRILMAQQLQNTAATTATPAGKRGLAVGMAQLLAGGIGGAVEGQAIRKEEAAVAANRQKIAALLAGGATGSMPSSPTPGGSPSPSAPSGSGAGIGNGYRAYKTSDIEGMIRNSAAAHGVDPDTALRVFASEGRGGYVGDHGSSFGPFQLHYGGVANGGNAVGGMGDDFTKATGLDARDPSTVPQQIDFAMAQAAKGGWGPWHGAQRIGLANDAGIGRTPQTPAGQMAATPGSTVTPPSIPNSDPGMMADAPAPNAQPVMGSGLPGDMMAPQGNMQPAQAGLSAGLGVAENQKFGNPSMMGAPSPYGIIPPGTGDVAAQSLPTALAPFAMQDTPAGTMTPNSGAPLPMQADPSMQAGTTVGDLPPAIRDVSNGIADAQQAGAPSFTGLPNGGLPAGFSPSDASPMAQMLAGGDVPMPPERPPQAMIDMLAGGSSPATPTPDSATTGSVATAAPTDPTPTGTIAPDMPAPNAQPVMAPGLPGDITAGGPGGGFAPIGKNANFQTPTQFNLAQGGGPQAMAALLAAPSAPPASPDPNASATPTSVGPGSAFRNVMDGGDLQQTAAQRYAQLMSQPSQGTSQGSAPLPTQADGQRLAMAQLIADPHTPPEVTAMLMQRLMPPVMGPEKLGAGDALYGRRADGSYGLIANNPAAPIALSPGQTLMGRDGTPIGSVPNTPDFAPVGDTGRAMDKHSGNTIGIPGGGQFQSTVKVNGVDIPVLVQVDPQNPGKPVVTPLTPGGTGPDGQPAQGGPLAGVQPIVQQANQMAADAAGQKKEAEAQVSDLGKLAQNGMDARQKLAQLDQLEQLSGKFGTGMGPKLASYLNEHGISNQSGSDQEAFKGLAGLLGVGMRPPGSGALRVAEMDRFQAALGNPNMTPADRLAAIGRLRQVYQRDAQIGDIAANGQVGSQDRLNQIHGLAAQPYSAGTPAAATAPPDGAVQYLRANPNLAAQFDAKYGAGASARVLGQ